MSPPDLTLPYLPVLVLADDCRFQQVIREIQITVPVLHDLVGYPLAYVVGRKVFHQSEIGVDYRNEFLKVTHLAEMPRGIDRVVIVDLTLELCDSAVADIHSPELDHASEHLDSVLVRLFMVLVRVHPQTMLRDFQAGMEDNPVEVVLVSRSQEEVIDIVHDLDIRELENELHDRCIDEVRVCLAPEVPDSQSEEPVEVERALARREISPFAYRRLPDVMLGREVECGYPHEVQDHVFVRLVVVLHDKLHKGVIQPPLVYRHEERGDVELRDGAVLSISAGEPVYSITDSHESREVSLADPA